MRLDLVVTPRRRIVPATTIDEERFQVFKPGDLMPVAVNKPRNGGNHRRFFALLQFIADNHPRYNTVPAVLLELKIRAHHYEEFITKDGEVVFVPRSISYDELDEAEFRELFDRCVDIAATDLVAGMGRSRLKAYLDGVTAFS